LGGRLRLGYWIFSWRIRFSTSVGGSWQTLYRNISELEELGVIVVSRKVGRAVMYRLNRENPVVKALNNLVNQLSLQIAEREELSTVSLREA